MPLAQSCSISAPNGSHPMPIDCTRSGSVSNGIATFNLTEDNTTSGTPVFSQVFPTTAQFEVRAVDALYQTGAVTVSQDRKTVSVPVKKYVVTPSLVTVLGISVIGSISTGMQNAPDGTVVDMIIEGIN